MNTLTPEYLHHMAISCGETAEGDALRRAADRIQELEEWNQQAQSLNGLLELRIQELEAERVRLRRALDNIKIRSYELNERELHDMALEALRGEEGLAELPRTK
jgi:hypothetical protein